MEYFKKHGIKSNSSLKEIKKVYNKLIMKYHPDRKTGNKIIFSEIELAYNDFLLNKNQENEKIQRQNEMFSKIENFKASYQDSEDEKNDIIKYYNEYKGNIRKIIDNLFCSSYSDEDRIRKIIEKLIIKGLLIEGKNHYKRVSNKKLKREKKEAKEVEETLLEKKTKKDDLLKKGLEDININSNNKEKK